MADRAAPTVRASAPPTTVAMVIPAGLLPFGLRGGNDGGGVDQPDNREHAKDRKDSDRRSQQEGCAQATSSLPEQCVADDCRKHERKNSQEGGIKIEFHDDEVMRKH
jgi:hypothetical protein